MSSRGKLGDRCHAFFANNKVHGKYASLLCCGLISTGGDGAGLVA